MSAVGIWPEFSDTPADFFYIPSTMGQGPSFGLGLALSQKKRRVIVINGDGCTLMNLGCLVTIAGNPADICLVVVDNGIYEVTGGQQTVGSGKIDFAGIASAAGIQNTFAFDSVKDWDRNAAAILSTSGPVFVQLKVEARFGRVTPKAPRPMAEQLERLKHTLGTI